MTPTEAAAAELEAEAQEARNRAIRRVAHFLSRNHAKGEVHEALHLIAHTPPELLGASDAAACLGVQRTNLHKWRVSDMPGPVQRVSNGSIPIYVAEDVRAYADRKRSES